MLVVDSVIVVRVAGNTSAAIPFYGIGVFAPIAFMGFSVRRHLLATKPGGYKIAAAATFNISSLLVFLFMSQIVGKFEEGGWIRLVTFSSLYISGHLILLNKGGERTEKLAYHLIHEVSRIEGTMAELLLWQTHMMQTYRENTRRRIANRWRAAENGGGKIQKLVYPPHQNHFDTHYFVLIHSVF